MIDRNDIKILQNGLRRVLDYESVLGVSAETNIPIAPPISASISITSRCNSDCMYCSFRSSLSKDKIDIPLDKLKSLIDDLSILGVKVLTFTGGEPLLRTDIYELCSYAKSHKMVVHITTNGILLTKDIAHRLYLSGVSNLIISLDSLDATIYKKHRGVSYSVMENALGSLVYFSELDNSNYGVVTFVLSKLNYSELPLFIKRLNEIDKKLLINIQPYHKPPTADFISQDLIDKASTEEREIYEALIKTESELSPTEDDRNELNSVIQSVIELKDNGYPVNNSSFYLKSIPDFLIKNKLPEGISCKAGYSGIYIQENLNMLPCWRLPAVGNLQAESALDLWFSEKYSLVRKAMLNHYCPKCMFLCHNETGWYNWYNKFYKENE